MRTALVIMRHAADRLLYGDVLERDGFQTARTAAIDEARKLALATRPSLLLIGLDDLASDELEFVRWAKQGMGARVLGITASPHGLGIGAMAGCDDCVLIPISMAEIMSIVGQLTASPAVTTAA
jgi:DNA-binding response OmpR family regulator